MSLNFFDASCSEPSIQHELFGLCDDRDGTKAYSNTSHPKKWVATVKNTNKIELTFTATDACVIKPDEQPGRGRCDGMLTSSEHLYFIELKEEDKAWINDAVTQLESTIEFFKKDNDITKYKHKKAFACNKRRPHFQETDNEFSLRFFRKHGFRIDVQAEIIII